MATLSASLPSRHPPGGKAPHRHAPAGRTLDALNFFLADVRDGLGPYLAIYLVAVRGPAHGWNEATVGLVLTIAGIVGLIAQTPAGSLIDKSRNKPRIVMVAALLVTLASVSLPFVTGFTVVTITQSVAAVAGAIFAPAISAITLGLVGPKMFAKRVGVTRRSTMPAMRCPPGSRACSPGRSDRSWSSG